MAAHSALRQLEAILRSGIPEDWHAFTSVNHFRTKVRDIVSQANALLDAGVDTRGSPAFMFACKTGNLNLVKRIFDQESGDIRNLEGLYKNYALQQALGSAVPTDLIRFLLDAGVSTEFSNGNSRGFPFVKASIQWRNNSEEIFDLFIERGLPLHDESGGMSALKTALLFRQDKLVEILVRKGAYRLECPKKFSEFMAEMDLEKSGTAAALEEMVMSFELSQLHGSADNGKTRSKMRM